MGKPEILINPAAPDDFWVSPSGSDVWCKVGQLKHLMTEVERLHTETLRLIGENALLTKQLGGRVSTGR